MRGDEARVAAAFVAHLEQEGWDVTTEVNFVDVVACRAGRTLLAEAKGRTKAPGLDIDTMYGQLLRRMYNDPHVRYAVVVPDDILGAALRVPVHVRELLSIDVYAVDERGAVSRR